MKKFDGLKAITDEQKFSEIIFDLIAEHKTPELFAKFLSEEFTDEGLRTLESIARSDYPLFLERNKKSPRLDIRTIALILQSIQGIAIILLGLSLIMR